MKNRNQGQMVVLSLLGMAVLFVSIIGGTFAYFSVNLQKNETEKEVLVKSKKLFIEYRTDNSLYYKSVIPGRPKWEEGQVEANKLKFTITSPTDMLAKNAYDVYLNISYNNFISNNIVYYVKENECLREDNSGSVLGRLSAVETIEYDMEGETVTLGRIPGGYVGRIKINENAILGGLGCSDEWEVEMWLYEVGTEQNEDQGKNLRASIEIEPTAIYPIDYEHDHNNDNNNNNHNNNNNNNNHNNNNNNNHNNNNNNNHNNNNNNNHNNN